MPQKCEAPRKGGATRESWPASRDFLSPSDIFWQAAAERFLLANAEVRT